MREQTSDTPSVVGGWFGESPAMTWVAIGALVATAALFGFLIYGAATYTPPPVPPPIEVVPVSPQTVAEREKMGSSRDAARREHIYRHLFDRLRAERNRETDNYLRAGLEPPTWPRNPIEEVRYRYDNTPIEELYDEARFKFGYKEPR